MLVIESKSDNSGTEVLIENVCIISDTFYKHTVFHQMKTAHLTNFDANLYFCQKCALISCKVIDYKHNILYLFE